MKITPQEIRQKQFEKKAFGGIDKDEVAAYMNQVAAAMERYIEESHQLRERLAQNEKETARLRELESTLYKTLKTAEDTGNQMVEQAKQSAQLQVREAEMKAESVVQQARWQAKNAIDDAKTQVQQHFQQLNEQMQQLEQECRTIERYRENLLSELKLLAHEIGEKAEREQHRVKPVEFRRVPPPAMPELAQEEERPSRASNSAKSSTQPVAAEEKSFFDTI